MLTSREPNREYGFSMIEILISLVLTTIGLLGIASATMRMMNGQLEAAQRSQAAILVADMAQRIYANSANAASYVTGTASSAVLGTGDSQISNCSTLAVGMQMDQCEWSNALKGAAEKSAGSNVGAMIGAVGCVELVQAAQPTPACLPGIYLVSVAWQGLSTTVAPVNACGQSKFGSNDAARRLISTQVVIGTGSC